MNKRRVMPNDKQLAISFNLKQSPDIISEHNDPQRIDWTEIPPKAPDFITGADALRIPEQSKPRYKLHWPIRHGWLNEADYTQKNVLFTDFFAIIEEAIKTELGLTKKDWHEYGCVFVIPDLYEKVFVTTILDEFMRDFGFKRICFMQEGLAASFGAGYSMACVVDIGAQKTSICCVEDGMAIEDSRINLKYGGWDVSELFIKMMLVDQFPYQDINLWRRYDFLLAEELKAKHCTMNEAEIAQRPHEMHVRAPAQDTRKYDFKTYDEIMLAPMVCVFQTDITSNTDFSRDTSSPSHLTSSEN
jgi:actin-related protein 8